MGDSTADKLFKVGDVCGDLAQHFCQTKCKIAKIQMIEQNYGILSSIFTDKLNTFFISLYFVGICRSVFKRINRLT